MSKEKKSSDKTVACSLSHFLEKSGGQYSQFYDLINGLCIQYVLSPKKLAGITVIFPNEKLLKKIATLADSGVYTDALMARKLIQSLILKAKIKNTDEWHKYTNDCPNWLGQTVPLKIDSNGKVLVNGKQVIHDNSFVDTSEKQNISVWKLLSDDDKGVGITNPESALKYDIVVKQPEKKGSSENYEGGRKPFDGASCRAQIISVIENHVSALCMIDASRTNSINEQTYFVGYSNSLLMYLNKPEYKNVFNRVFPLMTSDSMIDLYILIDPHDMSKEPLVEEYIIQGWWKTIGNTPATVFQNNTPNTFKQEYEDMRKDQFTQEVEKAIVDIQTDGDIMNGIRAAYKKLAETNSLYSSSKIFNDDFANYMKRDPEFKMLCDELKYVIQFKIQSSLDNGDGVGKRIEKLTNMIEDYMSNRGRRVSNFLGLIRSSDTYIDKSNEANIFINTDYFLSNVGKKYGKDPNSMEDVIKKALKNKKVDLCAYMSDQHKRTLGAIGNKGMIINSIREMKLDENKQDIVDTISSANVN